jgi:hypothetical protein
MSARANTLKTGGLRSEVAALAARMMAEDGISDFGFAKRKAARQLGITDSDALPNNAEIEAQLRIWHSLYQDEEQAERLKAMRDAALRIMRLFEQFNPYLTGGVLDGTAGRYSEIEIDLHPESSKDVEIFFLNQNIAYEHRVPRRPVQNGPEAVLCFDWNDFAIKLSLYDQGAERGGRRGVERARIGAVEAMTARQETAEE